MSNMFLIEIAFKLSFLRPFGAMSAGAIFFHGFRFASPVATFRCPAGADSGATFLRCGVRAEATEGRRALTIARRPDFPRRTRGGSSQQGDAHDHPEFVEPLPELRKRRGCRGPIAGPDRYRRGDGLSAEGARVLRLAVSPGRHALQSNPGVFEVRPGLDVRRYRTPRVNEPPADRSHGFRIRRQLHDPAHTTHAGP